jgi:hypothetical protein
MKKMNVLITVALMVTVLMSCKNSATDAERDAMSLNMFVDSVTSLTPVYTTSHWVTLNEGYQVRLLKSDETSAMLSASDKEELAASKVRFAALQTSYELKIKEQEMEASMKASRDYRQVLRNNLFGEGMVGNDLQFGFVTANNLLSVYDNFVNTVADNKKNYSREDWDEIKVLYEALGTRKNAVEKDLPQGHNLKIAGLKIKFSAIKATHRGSAKVAENKEAKQ